VKFRKEDTPFFDPGLGVLTVIVRWTTNAMLAVALALCGHRRV